MRFAITVVSSPALMYVSASVQRCNSPSATEARGRMSSAGLRWQARFGEQKRNLIILGDRRGEIVGREVGVDIRMQG